MLTCTLSVTGACRPTSNGDAPRGTEGTPQAAIDLGTTGSQALDAASRAFVDTAVAGGRAEIELAQLAQRKAQAADVKAMARRSNRTMRRRTTSCKASPIARHQARQTLTPEHQELMKRLEDLRAFAERTLPTLRAHLEHAETARASLTGSSQGATQGTGSTAGSR